MIYFLVIFAITNLKMQKTVELANSLPTSLHTSEDNTCSNVKNESDNVIKLYLSSDQHINELHFKTNISNKICSELQSAIKEVEKEIEVKEQAIIQLKNQNCCLSKEMLSDLDFYYEVERKRQETDNVFLYVNQMYNEISDQYRHWMKIDKEQKMNTSKHSEQHDVLHSTLSEKEKYSNDFKLLNEKHEELKKQIEEAKRTLHESRKSDNLVSESIKFIEEDYKNLREQKDNIENVCQMMEKNLEECTEKLKNITKEKLQFKRLLWKIQRQRKLLKAKYFEVGKKGKAQNKQIQNLSEKFTTINLRLESHKTEIYKLVTEEQSLKCKEEELLLENEVYKSQLNDTIQSNAEKVDLLKQLESSLCTIDNEYHKEMETSNFLKSEIVSLNEGFKELKTSAEELSDKNAEIFENINKMLSEQHLYQQKLNAFGSELSKVQNEIEILEDAIYSRKKESETINMSLDKDEKVATLESKLELISNSLKESEKECEEKVSDALNYVAHYKEPSNQKIAAYEDEIEKLKLGLCKLEEQSKELQDKLSAAKQYGESAETENNKLKLQMEDLIKAEQKIPQPLTLKTKHSPLVKNQTIVNEGRPKATDWSYSDSEFDSEVPDSNTKYSTIVQRRQITAKEQMTRHTLQRITKSLQLSKRNNDGTALVTNYRTLTLLK